MKNQIKPLLIVLTLLSTLNSQFSTAFAQGTAFTYQGRLNSGGSPASGTYNLTFSLFNTNTTGVAIAGPVTNNSVIVTNGLFTTLIDFGSGVFTGTTNWLEIGVETNGFNSFTTLTPRQQVTPTPYAIYAENANNLSGTLSASQLTSIGNTNVAAFGNFFVGPSGNSMTSGSYNTANGAYALYYNTSGSFNTANGSQALVSNTSGSDNTANGSQALVSNTSGSGNTANGMDALFSNTNGFDNTANGFQALQNNTSGSYNTANGGAALYNNTSGSFNTANGTQALQNNTNGSYNTANGYGALYNNISGTNNIALGYQAGLNITTGSYNIDIGNDGFSTDTNIIRIGDVQTQTFIAGVINGNGGGLTGLNVSAAQLSGTLANSQLANSSITVNAGTGLSGGGAVALGGSTTLNNAGVLSVTGNADITATTVSGAVTLGDTATSSATLGTLVKRDASGNFSAGVITATSFSGAFNGNGGGLTNLNASQLTSIGNTNVGASGNFFVGSAGNSTMSGHYNTGIGNGALQANTSGSFNTAIGYQALLNNTNAGNTAIGLATLVYNTSGDYNTGIGDNALFYNTNGSANTANGTDALFHNTSGSDNTANGFRALFYNTSGSNNIALGYQAGYNISTGSSNIDIGNQGLSTDGNIIRIGTPGVQTNTFIAGNVGLGGVTAPQQTLSLNGGLNIDQSSQNNGTFNLPEGSASSACLSFGNDSGEGIASQRTSGANQYDLFFCTQFTPRITILAGGNVGIGTTSPANLLQVGSSGSPAYCNGTTWVNGSDRNSKEGFAAIKPAEVLAKVAALPITEWKYKVEAEGTEHLGPMAQDFHAAFGLNGTDDKHIATVDEGGVALAAIQGLNQKLNEKDAEIQDLKARLEKVEQLINANNGGGK
jgi:hypothetical protein